ncbi:MAG: hypothetical protein HOV71_12530 [Hamadaea sp.]|uniref:hypothetical protein n=1 Tax=Hamadaea sp. NPDC050747 TaxID=3155789 RepID=UPI0017A379B7|nr:hypothetical protein [Hamadaea sp.]NUR48953.1 hypothetical protein [Hamadaea sp.]NUS02393.1 hypothetical protein [Nonomuraea sp.]NUT02448.1 hypothetical protein [Hamadaea sp.]
MANEWNELGEKLEGLGLKLKMHLQQSDTSEVPDALSKLGNAVQEVFAAAGNAVKDDAVRADVKEAGQMLGDALANTFSKASNDIRDRFGKKPGESGPEPTPDAPETKPADGSAQE